MECGSDLDEGNRLRRGLLRVHGQRYREALHGRALEEQQWLVLHRDRPRALRPRQRVSLHLRERRRADEPRYGWSDFWSVRGRGPLARLDRRKPDTVSSQRRAFVHQQPDRDQLDVSATRRYELLRLR